MCSFCFIQTLRMNFFHFVFRLIYFQLPHNASHSLKPFLMQQISVQHSIIQLKKKKKSTNKKFDLITHSLNTISLFLPIPLFQNASWNHHIMVWSKKMKHLWKFDHWSKSIRPKSVIFISSKKATTMYRSKLNWSTIWVYWKQQKPSIVKSTSFIDSKLLLFCAMAHNRKGMFNSNSNSIYSYLHRQYNSYTYIY